MVGVGVLGGVSLLTEVMARIRTLLEIRKGWETCQWIVTVRY